MKLFKHPNGRVYKLETAPRSQLCHRCILSDTTDCLSSKEDDYLCSKTLESNEYIAEEHISFKTTYNKLKERKYEV